MPQDGEGFIKTHCIMGNKQIGPNRPVYTIAEIGINHEGDLKHCKKLILAAQRAGADAVKLQTIDPDENYVAGTKSYEIFKQAWLEPEETQEAFNYAHSIGIDIFSTLGDFKTLNWLEKLNPCAFKISSGLLSATPLIDELLKRNLPLLISTGMSDFDEIEKYLKNVKKSGRRDIVLFHCTSLYPTPREQVYLEKIRLLKEIYSSYIIGFSDHSLGIDCSCWSILMGAKVIERHFSLDNKRKGFDHHISLVPEQYKKMVKKIREIEECMVASSEQNDLLENKKLYQRCLVARKKITKGETFSRENVAIKRPLPDKRGIEPREFYKLLGMICQKNLNRDDPITFSHY